MWTIWSDGGNRIRDCRRGMLRSGSASKAYRSDARSHSIFTAGRRRDCSQRTDGIRSGKSTLRPIMATSIVMPALEMAQETGKIVSWLKKEGDTVSKGEILLEVETDKAVVEVEAAADGVLAGVKSREGDVVPVGQTIAWLVAPGEQPPADSTSAAPTARSTVGAVREAQARERAASIGEAQASRTAPTEGEGLKSPQISPKARRLAKEKGVDIMKLIGTGPDGVITSDDVLKAAEAPAAAAPTLSAVARL